MAYVKYGDSGGGAEEVIWGEGEINSYMLSLYDCPEILFNGDPF